MPPETGDFFHSLEHIPIGIAVTSLEGRLLYVNPRLGQAIDYSPSELIEMGLERIIAAEDSPEVLQAIVQATLEGGWSGEVETRRRDGSKFPVYVENAVLRNREGLPLAIITIARDMTEEHALQIRLVREEKLGTLGLIAYNVAHEIRNHLSAIKMSLYMLENPGDSPAPGDRDLHFSIAREELNRIELFLRTLVNYARPPQPRLETSGLLEVVEQGLNDARPLLLRKSIALLRQFPSVSPRVRVDRRQLAQAVTQLVQNASEATDGQGEIHVVVKRQVAEGRTWWLVEVRDNGPGIPTHLQKRVFEPFFSTTQQRLGLGLNNVKRIMELHGGEVELISMPGRGAALVLKVPERQEEPA